MQTIHRTAVALLASGALAIGAGGFAWADDTGTDADAAATTTDTFVFLTGEEKLAHDIYTALGEQYDARQFDRIAASETRHLAAMRTVLASLGVDDPTEGDAAGVFDDPQLQDLYRESVARGSESLAAAAAVGIAVEEADIAALTDALDIAPDDQAIAVLEQQIAASQRHLAAFQRLAQGASPADCDATGGPGAGAGGPGAGAGGPGAGAGGPGAGAGGQPSGRPGCRSRFLVASRQRCGPWRLAELTSWIRKQERGSPAAAARLHAS